MTIPEDIRKRAEQVYLALWEKGASLENAGKMIGRIAAIIHDERERCAKIAEEFADKLEASGATLPEFQRIRRRACASIAAKIRSGE